MLKYIMLVMLLLAPTTLFAQDVPEKTAYMFTASWCNPCQNFKREILPDKEVQRLLKLYTNGIYDIDKYPGLTRAYGINTVPTWVFGEIEEINGRDMVRIKERWRMTSGDMQRQKERFIEALKKHAPKPKNP